MDENIITMKKNGTTFTVVVKSADKAHLTLDELMRKLIEKEAISLETLDNTGKLDGSDEVGE